MPQRGLWDSPLPLQEKLRPDNPVKGIAKYAERKFDRVLKLGEMRDLAKAVLLEAQNGHSNSRSVGANPHGGVSNAGRAVGQKKPGWDLAAGRGVMTQKMTHLATAQIWFKLNEKLWLLREVPA